MRITLWGAVGNCILTALKVAAGIVGNSAAMIADGVHSLSDLISDFVVIVFVHISSAERDEGHKYGHGKFETLATLAVSLILLGVGIKLMQDGISDIIRFARGEDLPTPDMIALYMALVSIAAKEVMYQLTVHVGKKVGSQVVVANAWHHRSDAISSVGSMIGIGGAILLGRPSARSGTRDNPPVGPSARSCTRDTPPVRPSARSCTRDTLAGQAIRLIKG